MLERITAFAAQVHQGQKDMAGVDYMQHLFAVRTLAGGSIQTQAAALLHDVLEDGADMGEFYRFCMTLDGLDGKTLFESVCLLSKNALYTQNGWILGESLSNDDYYWRMINAQDSEAGQTSITVKIADLTHNRDLSRLYGKKGYRSYTGDEKGFSQWVLENRKSLARRYKEYGRRLAQLKGAGNE